MASAGEKLVSGKGSLEEDDTHHQQVGGGAVGVRFLFKGCGVGDAALWIGYLGGHPPHSQDPGVVSGPGGKTTYGTVPAKDTGQEVDIHLGGNGTGGGGALTIEEYVRQY